MIELTSAALALIVEHEGINQPWRWPGGASGVTLGLGYDLAHCSVEEFRRDWGPHLLPAEIERLARAVGLSGIDAAAKAGLYKSIRITKAMAEAVFRRTSLPKYAALAAQAFPGVERLPPDAQGALLSLVYNRGPDTDEHKPSRFEMAAIEKILADGVQAGDLQAIAAQLRAMKRLWEGKRLAGLIARREAEARLIESCIATLT